MASEIDQKIQDVFKRIHTERKILEASQSIRLATSNADVLRKNDAKIREAEGQLAYFEDMLRELQKRKQSMSQNRSSVASSISSGETFVGPPPDYDSTTSTIGPGSPDARDGAPAPPKPKTYTNLDLIKADTHVTTARISRMLHQLEFKLKVEDQYKKGIDKMAKLYQAEGDKKSRADAEGKRVESEKKIQLLQTSLKRYRNLHILDVEPEEEDDTMTGKENLRSKALSGTLHVSIGDAVELEHAPIVSRSRSAAKQGVETYVSIKVEGTPRAWSHISRNDSWHEDFEIIVDKANEVEIAIYDRQIGEPHPIPVGLLWIRISDLVEALRRQRVMEGGQGHWVPANAVGSDSGPSVHGSSGDMNTPLGLVPSSGSGFAPPTGSSPAQEGIKAYFSVEPVGAIALHLNFIKENVRRRPMEAVGGLGRQGAVRKRKDEVHEMNGHKFVQKQFYQLILCAFCNEFLLNALGYQCEDCRYTCHKKCYEKVVTKCISKSNTGDDDEEKINHRIPHRFEPITNMGANWCCHCGYMLPLGRKNARKCSECDITCHAHCAHLVPDFCGMSMETANQLLRQWRDINRIRLLDKTPKQTGRLHMPSPTPPETLHTAVDRLKLSAPNFADVPQPQQTQSPIQDRPHPSQRYQQQPLPSPPQGQPTAPPRTPVSKIPVPPVYDHEQQASLASRPLPSYDDGRGFERPSSQPQVPPKQYPPGQLNQIRLPGTERLPPSTHSIVPSPQPARKRKVGLDDFNFLAVLGKGNFGKVMLAEEKHTNKLYAIKVLKKEFIIDNDEVESTRSEKRVFLAAAKERHPFLLGLHSCFQTETRVYFVMEYVSGGDLMLHIQRKQFSPRQAKFYASEVLLALEYFHANGIIYRDLKLDNILLTLDGHVKVADYGLCKEEMWFGSTTSTFCGTPEFMAPEILLENRYGRAVDWWAFGVLMYEMLLGQSPFRGDDEDEIFDAILEDEPLYPITMPRDAVSILQKLLTRDPNRRLGSGQGDAEEIKRQPFFKDVNWDDVVNKSIPPPYFPTINGSADTSNFDEEFTKEQPTLTPVHGQLSSNNQAMFNGFSWVASWAEME